MLFLVELLTTFAIVHPKKQKHSLSFRERYPPIDDDEFVRRCGPGANRDVALRVRRIVAEQLGIEYSRVYPEQRFVEDLDCG